MQIAWFGGKIYETLKNRGPKSSITPILYNLKVVWLGIL